MNELQWTPAQVAELNVFQIAALFHAHAPGARGPITTEAEYLAMLAEETREAEEWHSS